jgi:type II secretory pathway pseudopilin PulG
MNSPRRPRLTAHRSRSGMTVLEILLVISVIMVLSGMVTSAAMQVSRSSRIASAGNMVQTLQNACTMYQSEDCQGRMPTGNAALTMQSTLVSGGPAGNLDLLAPYHVPWLPSQLDASGNFLDSFRRPYQYLPSAPSAPVAPWAPAAAPGNWNAENRQPYAYVWSLGPPTGNGDASDANPSVNLTRWIYPKSSP